MTENTIRLGHIDGELGHQALLLDALVLLFLRTVVNAEANALVADGRITEHHIAPPPENLVCDLALGNGGVRTRQHLDITRTFGREILR
jgi:hypothetical protein